MIPEVIVRKSSFGISVVSTMFIAILGQGCSDGGGGTSTSSSSSSGTAGAGGGTGGSGNSGGEGGSGGTAGTGGSGGAMNTPFTSEGPSSYESQTQIVADTKGNIVAAWMAFGADGSATIGYAVSRDTGKNWTAPKTIAAPDGRLSSNPTLAIDSQARVALVWAGFRPDFNNPDEHIYLSLLDGQTETFAPPAVASDDGVSTTLDFDKPSVTVDANDDWLVSWADFTGTNMGGPASLVLGRSADGKTFTRTTVTNDATFGNLAYVCLDRTLGANAPLYMVHLGANGTVTLRVSADKGQTWTLRSTPATNALFQDITCGVQGQNVWIAYASGTAPFMPGYETPADAAVVMHSKDGGTTFEAPAIVSKPATGEVVLYPRLAISAAGKVGVVHYQGKPDAPAKFMLSSSTNGSSWTNSPIADSGTLTLDRTIASWLGGYVGFAIAGEKGYVTYADNSVNKSHVHYAEIALP
jgi:hypothetical protein